MPTQPNQLNLVNMFQTVTSTLKTNQQSLNQADVYNHDHGDNMVEVFNVISQAMQEKQTADPADQLAYASQILKQRKSGSSQIYAQGLSKASQNFKGQKQITPDNAISLIQTLIGGGQTQATESPTPTGDMISMLLGSSNNNSPAQSQNEQASDGIDAGDLLNAGMAFLNSKSHGESNVEAIVNAIVSGSAMGNSDHRTQSSTLVVNSLLQAFGGMLGSK